ncbi:MAG: methyltransferase domain-containing protein [Desulfuromonadales bacterium]|nr:methyltransferase domain-containing protein [Desulfuromonadales bacterium]
MKKNIPVLTILDKLAGHYRHGDLVPVVAGKIFELSMSDRKGLPDSALRCLRQTSVIGWMERWTTHRNLRRNKTNRTRRLDIGPGEGRLPGFETLNIAGGRNIDYVLDATQPLPFPDGTFVEVFSSHVLEHLPWYSTERILQEWVRILKPGGQLQIWVPDALKICSTILEAEEDLLDTPPDGWRKLNPDDDPYLWAAGRLFYGVNHHYPSWHRALFTPKFLQRLLRRVGLVDVRRLAAEEVRGADHGWINLGVGGAKPRQGSL